MKGTILPPRERRVDSWWTLLDGTDYRRIQSEVATRRSRYEPHAKDKEGDKWSPKYIYEAVIHQHAAALKVRKESIRTEARSVEKSGQEYWAPAAQARLESSGALGSVWYGVSWWDVLDVETLFGIGVSRGRGISRGTRSTIPTGCRPGSDFGSEPEPDRRMAITKTQDSETRAT